MQFDEIAQHVVDVEVVEVGFDLKLQHLHDFVTLAERHAELAQHYAARRQCDGDIVAAAVDGIRHGFSELLQAVRITRKDTLSAAMYGVALRVALEHNEGKTVGLEADP